MTLSNSLDKPPNISVEMFCSEQKLIFFMVDGCCCVHTLINVCDSDQVFKVKLSWTGPHP